MIYSYVSPPTALLSFTVLHYALAFSAVVLFYVYYTTGDDCTEHKIFISLNLIFCIIISIVAVLPKVQVRFQSRKIETCTLKVPTVLSSTMFL